MEKLATTITLNKIALGEIDLDEISEVLRSSEMIIKSFRTEVADLQNDKASLQQGLDEEKRAVTDLTSRLVDLHEENRMAKELFRTEIEGKLEILGTGSALDVKALNMAGLIKQRELVQRQMGRCFSGVEQTQSGLSYLKQG